MRLFAIDFSPGPRRLGSQCLVRVRAAREPNLATKRACRAGQKHRSIFYAFRKPSIRLIIRKIFPCSNAGITNPKMRDRENEYDVAFDHDLALAAVVGRAEQHNYLGK